MMKMFRDTVRLYKSKWFKTRYVVLYAVNSSYPREVIRKIFEDDKEWVTYGLTTPDLSQKHAYSKDCYVQILDNGVVNNDRKYAVFNHSLRWKPYIPFETKLVSVPEKQQQRFPKFEGTR